MSQEQGSPDPRPDASRRIAVRMRSSKLHVIMRVAILLSGEEAVVGGGGLLVLSVEIRRLKRI